jgi:hypothetical protein
MPSHADLVARAASWLKAKGCGVVLTELVTVQSETPDAIGWRDAGASSYLIECKTSRSDFHADKRKGHRRGDVPALGRFRYFLCPPGLIKPEELPPRWGLLYAHPRKVELVHGRNPTCWHTDLIAQFSHDVNQPGELRLMYSALNRLRVNMGTRDLQDRVHLPYAGRQKRPAAPALSDGERAPLQPISSW